MSPSIHLKKLCVGISTVEELKDWRQRHRKMTGLAVMSHTTRMWPKRAEELQAGGSLYWIVSGEIRCRQLITGFEEVTKDGHRACRIMLDDKIVETAPRPHRPFQGWRYLKPEEAPSDLAYGDQTTQIPADLKSELADLGLL